MSTPARDSVVVYYCIEPSAIPQGVSYFMGVPQMAIWTCPGSRRSGVRISPPILLDSWPSRLRQLPHKEKSIGSIPIESTVLDARVDRAPGCDSGRSEFESRLTHISRHRLTVRTEDFQSSNCGFNSPWRDHSPVV